MSAIPSSSQSHRSAHRPTSGPPSSSSGSAQRRTKVKGAKDKKRPARAGALRDVTNSHTNSLSHSQTRKKPRSEAQTPICASSEQEDALEGMILDEGFFDWRPSPESTPLKPKLGRIPSGVKDEGRENSFSTPGGREMKQEKEVKLEEEKTDEDVKRLLEGAEHWDWGDMLSSPVKAEPLLKLELGEKLFRDPCTRCVVESSTVTSGKREQHVQARIDHTSSRILLILRDDWSFLPLHAGDTLNVHAPLLPPPSTHSPDLPTIVVSASQGMVVHHPDVLLPPTMVSTASQCTRKPLVSALLRSSPQGGEGGAKVVLWGNLLHEVVQRCMTASAPPTSGAAHAWTPDLIDHHLRSVLYSRTGVEGCFRAGVTVDEALSELRRRSSGLIEFSKRFMRAEPSSDGVLKVDAQEGETWLALRRTRGVEEDVWSPSWGLKGKVDASVQVSLSTPKAGFFDSRTKGERQVRKGTMPFEIKTGRPGRGVEHRAQTMLYTLLLGERYEEEIPSGLLYYTQSAEVIQVSAKRNELRALLMARNDLAEWTMGQNDGEAREQAIEVELGDVEEMAFLPEPLDDPWSCGKCYALDGCMLYRRTHDPLPVPSDMEDLFVQKTSHISSRQATFFRTWERLVSLEENDMNRFRAELWTMTAQARESAGRCFADMVVIPLREEDKRFLEGDRKIHTHTARFVKRATITQRGETLLNGHISVGDPVVVSADPGLLALARGFVLSLSPDAVVLGLDHAVDEEALKELPIKDVADLVWRIDKDELSTGISRLRDNLAQLFYASGDERRRSLVVDLDPPTFASNPAFDPSELSSALNAPQRTAIAKVAAAKDYALILGMPGTGKTSTIAEIIRMLVRQGKSVLLTSYTHSAVDTILLRLGEVDFDVLRLGNTDKVHPDLKKYTLAARPQATTVQQLENQLLLPPVVATTCLSIDHPLFARRKNRAARKGGLDVSLFRRLSDAHPEAVVDLTLQYRMNEDIMLLSNRLIYNDRLQCGSEETARRSLVLKDKSPLAALHTGGPCDGCWLEALLDERCKAVFVDTDLLPARDSRVGDLVQNEIEASIVAQLANVLIACGLRPMDIGILSLYRQQIKLISHLLRSAPGVEILTADRSQGRDKECILISMVRSNETGELGELLKDWRRLNVSFTRARSKLVIVGSRNTLGGTLLMREFFDLMTEKGWIYALKPGAHLLHAEQLGCPSLPPMLKRLSEEPENENEERKSGTPPKKVKVEAHSLSPAKRAILSDIINAL
ncbi:Dna2-domain-containing protein [Dacryopinax primogenitus]|uniref:DNA replication ATP-dependent helicase/nuclease DNA2 n=1 Tax=Dacryopinax primogenitus (strain DJM 731) TaxID=1858805 RepID=M5G1C4_DACPD|nr:Dna2-domain-containing protein [Dacryopinax primogenitus]EJT99626.1 Dna2-domain-containing protein [Dacryopinax primogenitus]